MSALNACSIFSAGCWCVAFIASMRSVWKIYRMAGFFLCQITSVGWTLSSAARLPAADPLRHRPGVLSQTGSAPDFARTRCIPINVRHSHAAVRTAAERSAKARSFVFFLKANWNAEAFFCDFNAVMN